MKLITIIGARPQFIKASALSKLVKKEKKLKKLLFTLVNTMIMK